MSIHKVERVTKKEEGHLRNMKGREDVEEARGSSLNLFIYLLDVMCVSVLFTYYVYVPCANLLPAEFK